MRQLTLDELDQRSDLLEAAVDATPGIDHWCSGPDWVIPVTLGFAPTAERIILATEADDGFAMFARYEATDGTPLLSGLEPLWGFGAPIVGDRAAATGAADHLVERRDWQTIVLPGMPFPGEVDHDDNPPSQTTNQPGGTGGESLTIDVARALSRLGEVGLGEGITRQVADIGNGYDAWLARRSARFRRNLRQAAARADEVGLAITDVSAEPGLFERIMAIEHRSWKGREGSGITSPEMSTMYRLMVGRLTATNRLVANVATIGDEDVGYILGGLRGRRYRGLQISYIADLHAQRLSVGNLLQDHQLHQLDERNLADTYDLGMDFGYKRRWADRAETSFTLVVHRA